MRRGHRCGAITLGLVLACLAAAAPAPALLAAQPSGRAGCIDADGSGGCTRAASLSSDSRVGPLVVSPNGAFVYAADRPFTESEYPTDGRLLIFARDRSSGALRELPGRRGCIENAVKPVPTQRGPCEQIGGIENPDELLISPDGRRLYVATAGNLGSYLVTFAVNPHTGEARRLQCLTNAFASRCAKTSMDEPRTLLVTSDSRFLYVGSLSNSAVGASPLLSVYRAGAHGLTAEQCLAAAAITDLGCTVAPLLGDGSVDGLAEAPEGSTLYASAAAPTRGGERVLALARDPASGRLSPLSGPGDCVSDEPTPPPPCSAVALTGTDLAMSPSGETLYTATKGAGGQPGSFGAAVLVRDGSSGALSELAGPSACVAFDSPLGGAPVAGCGSLPSWAVGLELPTLAASASVLLAPFDEFQGGNGVVQITPSPPSGALTASDVRGCKPERCAAARGTEGSATNTPSIVLSPDGRSLYLAEGPGIAQLRVK